MARRARLLEETSAPADDHPEQPLLRRDLFYTSSDGLQLHVAEYGDPISPWLPVVCLPGLSRSARDFDDLARHLATHRHRPRRVLAFDYRGRGRSAWDPDIAHYNPLTEMADVLDGLAALNVPRAVVVGTSRGGIIAMMMGVARPAIVAGVVLNDVGTVIEPRGLARIKSYIGRTPDPDDWADAAGILKRLHGARFTGLDNRGWDAFARMTYRDSDGRPAGDYDPALARTFDGIEFDRPVPTLWKEFDTLLPVPVLLIRGQNSDLLSSETAAEMVARHPLLELIEVPGEGHAPLLRQPSLLNAISAFVTGIEGSGPPADAVFPVRQAPDQADPDSPEKA